MVTQTLAHTGSHCDEYLANRQVAGTQIHLLDGRQHGTADNPITHMIYASTAPLAVVEYASFLPVKLVYDQVTVCYGAVIWHSC